MSTVKKIVHDFADIWIAVEHQQGCQYYYGGTRMSPPQTTDVEVVQEIERLMLFESALKNRLINIALGEPLFQSYEDQLPQNFTKSVVGGARCIFRPRDEKTYAILRDPKHECFHEVLRSLFFSVGEFLNRESGSIKLTPDFGRFSGLADILAEFTPHVLGIRCEDGGCGGKSSYSSTGVLAALQTTGAIQHKDQAITLIGSAGAMGSGILAFFSQESFRNLAICDLVYDRGTAPAFSGYVVVLPSTEKMFTEACLRQGGTIVATTLGRELENSAWQLIPPDTRFFLAHNLAIPQGEEGVQLMRKLDEQGVEVWPGQILTLGGALTSRLEWFWRQSKQGVPFNKPLAHRVVREVVQFLVLENQKIAAQKGISPYEAMLLYAGSLMDSNAWLSPTVT